MNGSMSEVRTQRAIVEMRFAHYIWVRRQLFDALRRYPTEADILDRMFEVASRVETEYMEAEAKLQDLVGW